MTTVRVELENRNWWVTPINTDFDGAVDYFFGAGCFEQPDETVSRVVRVSEVLPDGRIGQSVAIPLILFDFAPPQASIECWRASRSATKSPQRSQKHETRH
jgi:hypothetical protein